MSRRITVIGDGGWGTALALVLNGNGHRVTVWGPFEETIRDIVSTQTDLTSTQTDLVSTQTDLASTQTDVDGIHGQIHALLQYAF